MAVRWPEKEERADDGIRTRDPHLGKVMRYQLRYIRMHPVWAVRELLYTGGRCRFYPPPETLCGVTPGVQEVTIAGSLRMVSPFDRMVCPSGRRCLAG